MVDNADQSQPVRISGRSKPSQQPILRTRSNRSAIWDVSEPASDQKEPSPSVAITFSVPLFRPDERTVAVIGVG